MHLDNNTSLEYRLCLSAGRVRGMQLKSALVIWNGPEGGTSANLFKALASELASVISVKESANPLDGKNAMVKLFRNIKANLLRIPSIAATDCIIVHSYAVLSLLSIAAAKILGKEVYVFNWDIYPTTIAGERRGGLLRGVADSLESIAVGMSTCVVVPNRDFEGYIAHPNIVELPLWPSSPNRPFAGPNSTDIVKVGFAGQLDRSRGVDLAINRIRELVDGRVEFHVFSSGQRLAMGSPRDCEIIYYDRLPREAVQKSLSQMNYGLISLHPELDQPGYPSKVFDYLAANAPILYFGRPLPAFTREIEAAGVGMVLGDRPVDLRERYNEFISGWEDKRSRFLSGVQLDRSKLMRTFAMPEAVESFPARPQ